MQILSITFLSILFRKFTYGLELFAILWFFFFHINYLELPYNTVYWFDNPKTFVPILGLKWELVIFLYYVYKTINKSFNISFIHSNAGNTFLPLEIILLPEQSLF